MMTAAPVWAACAGAAVVLAVVGAACSVDGGDAPGPHAGERPPQSGLADAETDTASEEGGAAGRVDVFDFPGGHPIGTLASDQLQAIGQADGGEWIAVEATGSGGVGWVRATAAIGEREPPLPDLASSPGLWVLAGGELRPVAPDPLSFQWDGGGTLRVLTTTGISDWEASTPEPQPVFDAVGLFSLAPSREGMAVWILNDTPPGSFDVLWVDAAVSERIGTWNGPGAGAPPPTWARWRRDGGALLLAAHLDDGVPSVQLLAPGREARIVARGIDAFWTPEDTIAVEREAEIALVSEDGESLGPSLAVSGRALRSAGGTYVFVAAEGGVAAYRSTDFAPVDVPDRLRAALRGAVSLIWHPRDEAVALRDGAGTFVYDFGTGETTELAGELEPIMWSRDGARLLLTSGVEVAVWDGVTVSVTTAPGGGVVAAAITPGGKVAVLSRTAQRGEFVAATVDGGAVLWQGRVVAPCPEIAWSGDGTALAIHASRRCD